MMELDPNRAVFGDVDGRSTTEDLGKEATPYRFLLTRELLGVYRDAEGRTGMQRIADGMVAGEQSTLCGGGDRTACPLVILGINPSTATRVKNDNTISKEIGFAQRLGFGRLVKGNAYGWRDKKPKHMWAAHKAGRDIVGRDNDKHIRDALMDAWTHDGMVLVAWSKHPRPDRLQALRAMIDSAMLIDSAMQAVPVQQRQIYCLRTNKDGSPEHPLYIPYATAPTPWQWPS